MNELKLYQSTKSGRYQDRFYYIPKWKGAMWNARVKYAEYIVPTGHSKHYNI